MLLGLAAPAGRVSAQAPAKPAPAAQPTSTSSLDAFMEKVLAKREVNRKLLNQYILDETESFEIFGPGRMPLHRSKRDFTWYVRDGMHVRSPVRFDGVAINAQTREEYEADWIKHEKERREREQKKKEQKSISIGSAGISADGFGTAVPSEPRFVSEAYFMDFKF